MGRPIAVVTLLASLLLAACGGRTPSSDSTASQLASRPTEASVAGGTPAAAPATTAPVARPEGAAVSGQEQGSSPDPACNILTPAELDRIMGEGHGPIHTTFHSKGTCSVETGDRSAQIELECGGYGTLQWNDYHPIGKPVEGTKHVLTAPTFGYFVRLHHVPGRGECTLSGYPAAEIKAAMNAVTQGASDKEARQAAQVTGSQEALVSALDRAYDEAAA